MQDSPVPDAPAIETRRDGAGNWTSALPLGLLALMALMLLHACISS
jgi:hypothetical protein